MVDIFYSQSCGESLQMGRLPRVAKSMAEKMPNLYFNVLISLLTDNRYRCRDE